MRTLFASALRLRDAYGWTSVSVIQRRARASRAEAEVLFKWVKAIG